MAEFRKWKKITDQSLRIIAYYKDYKNEREYLELADVLQNIKQHDFDIIRMGLLEQGYKIKLDEDKYDSKRKIKVGINNYSYFTLEKTKLRDYYDTLKDAMDKIECQARSWADENKKLKERIRKLEKASNDDIGLELQQAHTEIIMLREALEEKDNKVNSKSDRNHLSGTQIKKYNERGAGRKTKINEELGKKILDFRAEKMTYADISTELKKQGIALVPATIYNYCKKFKN